MTLASHADSLHPPQPDQLDPVFPGRPLVFSNGRTAIRECGQGPVVVLLHGIGSGAASWLQVARLLSTQARIIAWDAPGYGESSQLSAAAPRAEDYARRLEQVLDALDIQQCLLVGHSLGAMTALAVVSGAQASRVTGLLLISPARGYGSRERQVLGQQVRASRQDNLKRYGIDGVAERRSHHLLSAHASSAAHQWVRWNMARLNQGGYLQAVDLLCDDDLLRFPPPPLPCEVLCGEHDSVTLPDECRLIARRLAANFALIAGAGHASQIEQPGAVAERIVYALNTSHGGIRP